MRHLSSSATEQFDDNLFPTAFWSIDLNIKLLEHFKFLTTKYFFLLQKCWVIALNEEKLCLCLVHGKSQFYLILSFCFLWWDYYPVLLLKIFADNLFHSALMLNNLDQVLIFLSTIIWQIAICFSRMMPPLVTRTQDRFPDDAKFNLVDHIEMVSSRLFHCTKV